MTTRGKIGAHMSIAGGYHRAPRAAQAVGFDAVQLFVKSTNQWKAAALTDAHVADFRAALAASGIAGPIAHASYLINLGSPDEALWNRSIEALTIEVERCAALGIGDLVAHPGAHMGAGEGAGLARIAAGLDEVARRTKGVPVVLDLETTAGQGTCLGHRFEHLGAIVARVAAPERLGLCVDTCHIFAAGYPLATPAEYHETIDDLDRNAGIGLVRVWHLNDSRRERGSRVDRHAGIGLGHLGVEPFRNILNDPRFRSLPKILETPKGTDAEEGDLDTRNLRVLRALEAGGVRETPESAERHG